jgi:DNA-binding transcriptional LysR family regulator
MDLRQIMYFMCVYEEASFTKAARKVGVVQPALSAQIGRLEDEFGGALFSRTPRGVVPTALGKSFYELCQPIRLDIAEAKHRMLELRQPDQVFGPVRCGFPPSYFKAALGTILTDFVERHPHVELTVRESYGGTLRQWVAAGELDFAFGTSPQHQTGLADASIFEEDVALVSGAPIAGEPFRPCDLGSIDKLKLMLPSLQHVLGPSLREHIATGLIKPQRTMIVDSYVGVLEIAKVSDWAVLIPITGLLDEVFNPKLFIYPVKRPFLTFRWHVIHEQGKPLTAAAKLLIDAVVGGLTAKRRRWEELCAQRKTRAPKKKAVAARKAQALIARKPASAARKGRHKKR